MSITNDHARWIKTAADSLDTENKMYLTIIVNACDLQKILDSGTKLFVFFCYFHFLFTIFSIVMLKVFE